MQDEYVRIKLKALGKAIKELRMAHNLTQMKLAQLAEVDSSNLQKIEAGKNTTVDTLVRICGALHLEEYLLFDYAWNKNKKAEFENLIEVIRKKKLSAAANLNQCENARPPRLHEEKSFSHARSCRGGHRCYNENKDEPVVYTLLLFSKEREVRRYASQIQIIRTQGKAHAYR